LILVLRESWTCTRRKRTSIDGHRPQRSRTTDDAGQAEREREREREREMLKLKLKTEGETAAEIVNAVGIGRASVLRILKEAA